MEKIYKKMTIAGAGNIAIGIIALVAGLVCGIVTIVNGAIVLAGRKDILL